MIQIKNSAQLKSNARGQLIGKYGTYIPALLIVEVISFLLTNLVSSVSDLTSLSGMILYGILSVLVSLVINIFYVGNSRIILQICCQRSIKVSDIIYGFSHQLDKIIQISMRLLAISLIPSFFGAIPLAIGIVGKNIWIILLGFVIILAVLIVVCYMLLRYSLVYFILLDFPQYTVSQIFHMSQLLMKGNMARLLYLLVSFLPLYLLSAFSCFIANFWISPYLYVTFGNFYCNLVKVAASKQTN